MELVLIIRDGWTVSVYGPFDNKDNATEWSKKYLKQVCAGDLKKCRECEPTTLPSTTLAMCLSLVSPDTVTFNPVET